MNKEQIQCGAQGQKVKSVLAGILLIIAGVLAFWGSIRTNYNAIYDAYYQRTAVHEFRWWTMAIAFLLIATGVLVFRGAEKKYMLIAAGVSFVVCVVYISLMIWGRERPLDLLNFSWYTTIVPILFISSCLIVTAPLKN